MPPCIENFSQNTNNRHLQRIIIVVVVAIAVTVKEVTSIANCILQCELVVEVRGSSGEGSQARVLVQVGDRNEHAPYFPRALHETQITEEDDRHLPKTVLTVSLTPTPLTSPLLPTGHSEKVLVCGGRVSR